MNDENLYRRNKISMIITNFVRLSLIVIFIWGIVKRDYSQTFLIALTFFMTFYPSILEKNLEYIFQID